MNNYSGDPAFAGYKCVFCIIGGPAYLGLTLIILGIIIGLIIGKIRKK